MWKYVLGRIIMDIMYFIFESGKYEEKVLYEKE